MVPPVAVNSNSETTPDTTANSQNRLSRVANAAALAAWTNYAFPVERDDVSGAKWVDTGASCTNADGYAQVQPAAGHCWKLLPITLANLPASGVTAGTYSAVDPGANFSGANDRTVSPVVDTYGRTTGLSVSLITAAAFGDVFQLGGTVARNLASHFFDHLSVRDFGAVCDGGTDDHVAINNALKTGFYVELPQQTCAFTSGLVFVNPYSQLRGSGMWGASRLLYTGTSTNIDLLTIGSTKAPTNTSGVVSQGFQNVEDLLIESNTKMTAGSAIRSWGQQFINFHNVALGRQGDSINLWNGFSFNQIDAQRVDGYFVAVQNDGFQMYGFGAEPGSGVGTGTSGSGTASGPQYEVWVDNGRVQNAHIAFHVGGGIDGVYVDHTMATNDDYDLVVDNALSPHPNQEVVFGSQAFLDGAHWDTVYINDPKCLPINMCEVVLAGPVLHAGTLTGTAGVATGSSAGQAAPANSGNGVHIKAYPGGTVDFYSPYSIDYAYAAVYNEDSASVLYMNPAMHVGTSAAGASSSTPLSPKGIYSTVAGWAPKVMPSLVAFANVATPLTNVITPDLTSATGGLKVGLGTTTNNYAQSVISNLGAEGLEVGCGTRYFNANGCRQLFYNRSAGTYVDHTDDASTHTFSVGGTPEVAITGTTTQIKNSLQILPATPANNGNCAQGQVSVDANYVYVCTAANTWKRAALTAY